MSLIERRMSTNSTRQCSVNGCYKHRHNLATFCSSHLYKKRQHGHELGRAIEPKEYSYERVLVMDFIDRYGSQHEGLQVVLRELDCLLNEGRYKFKPRAQELLTALAGNGVDGGDILEVTASLFLKSLYDERTLPDDKRLTFAIGRAMQTAWNTGLKKRQPSPAVSKELGLYIRKIAGTVCFNMSNAIEKERAHKQTQMKAKLKPFNVEQDNLNYEQQRL